MSHVLLYMADIDPCLKEVRGVAVSQGVDADPLALDIEFFQDFFEDALDGTFSHRMVCMGCLFTVTAPCGEEPEWVSVGFPIIS